MENESQTNNQVPASLAGQAAELPSTHANIQIRTQESDVESLKQTGGAHPLPETVSVDSQVSTPAPAPAPADVSLPAQAPPISIIKTGRSFAWIFWAIGIVALFLIGYYVIPLFFG